MELIYTDQHRLHATEALNPPGESVVYEEIPGRMEAILAGCKAAGLVPPVAPVEHGLGPILAVHTRDYIDFLQGAYRETATYYGLEAPVYPETFAVRQVRRRSRHP